MTADGAARATARGAGRRPTAGGAVRPSGRLFEGWQLLVVAVGLPALSLWLSLPRPVAPELVPLPEVDRGAVRRVWDEERERARSAENQPLPFDVRAVGELVRRHGRASAAREANGAERARADAQKLVRQIVARGGARELAALRALQTVLFLDAARRFEQSGKGDRELVELGGDFVDKARSSGWIDAEGRLALSEAELVALFRMRWTELVGLLQDPRLRPSLADFRMYYRTLLEHPGGPPEQQDERRLAIVAALARRDGGYPAAFARGVLLYRLGRPAAAADEFQAHLAVHPDGPFAMRARNHALAALSDSQTAE